MTRCSDEVLLAFERRLTQEWLPIYCSDPSRNYDVCGFRGGVRTLSARDATDFAYSLDTGLVKDMGGGRYRAPRSMATEVLFWEGLKAVLPRPITLWLEPVITIAALGRLHRDYGWPAAQLGLQSADWAFDLVAYADPTSTAVDVACEVKKSSRELTYMIRCLHHFAAVPTAVSKCKKGPELNAARKWTALAAARPRLFWAVGPGIESVLFSITYDEIGPRHFASVTLEALHFAESAAARIAPKRESWR
jgi:hypothetical protein